MYDTYAYKQGKYSEGIEVEVYATESDFGHYILKLPRNLSQMDKIVIGREVTFRYELELHDMEEGPPSTKTMTADEHKEEVLEVLRHKLHGLFSDEAFEDWYECSGVTPDNDVEETADSFCAFFEEVEALGEGM